MECSNIRQDIALVLSRCCFGNSLWVWLGQARMGLRIGARRWVQVTRKPDVNGSSCRMRPGSGTKEEIKICRHKTAFRILARFLVTALHKFPSAKEATISPAYTVALPSTASQSGYVSSKYANLGHVNSFAPIRAPCSVLRVSSSVLHAHVYGSALWLMLWN